MTGLWRRWALAVVLPLLFWAGPARWWIRGDAASAAQALESAQQREAEANRVTLSADEIGRIESRAVGLLTPVEWYVENDAPTQEIPPSWWVQDYGFLHALRNSERIPEHIISPDVQIDCSACWAESDAPGVLVFDLHVTFQNESAGGEEGDEEGGAGAVEEAPQEGRGLDVLNWLLDINSSRPDMQLVSMSSDQYGLGTAQFRAWARDPDR